jgi:hypothetical protein
MLTVAGKMLHFQQKLTDRLAGMQHDTTQDNTKTRQHKTTERHKL